MSRLVDVALPVPLFRNFAYAVEDDFVHPIVPGSRVVVPFSGRREVGIVVATDVEPEEGRSYKAILTVPDPWAAITPPLLESCAWISRHYIAPLGVVLRAALPALLGSARAPTPSPKTRRVITIARALESLSERDDLFRRAPRQRQVYELVEALGGRAPVSQVTAQLGISDGVVRAMAGRALIMVVDESVLRDPFAQRAPLTDVLHAPTRTQQAAIDRIVAAGPGSVTLIHGVTGSGKTLVYLEVLRRVLADPSATAIVLVPEIALTPQAVARFRAVFGDQVAVLHSALSDGERLDAWLALRRGDRRIAVGARSAIFAPVSNVKLIVVDEEHEASYKQGETPRYHARDVAIARARAEGATVILGSATPALESWTRATSGQYALIPMPDRVGGGVLPSVEVVDLRTRRGPAGAPGAPPEKHDSPGLSPTRHASPDLERTDVISGSASPLPERIAAPPQAITLAPDVFRRVFSEVLERALRACIGRGEQAILLLNRRGYAAFLHCTSCEYVAQCPNCSISLTYHRTPERLACHYCLYFEPPRTTCHRCGSTTVRQRGLGTQQVERLLGERMPSLRVARMDVDTTSGKWAHADILDRVGRGDVDVLLGTQMIAKGLDFPNVTLVGVIDADVGINLPDFRSAERTYQLLAQVAGRAGRGAKGGHVIIQTRLGDHHAVLCAVTHDYQCFVTHELAQRQSPPYPPVTSLANVILSGTDENQVAEAAEEAAAWLQRLVTVRRLEDMQVIGPAPAPVERIKQRWRWHLLLRTPDSRQLTTVLRYFATRFKVPDRSGLRLTIDRDPVSLM
jgi:primosomal protein N' (replication factor Y)